MHAMSTIADIRVYCISVDTTGRVSSTPTARETGWQIVDQRGCLLDESRRSEPWLSMTRYDVTYFPTHENHTGVVRMAI